MKIKLRGNNASTLSEYFNDNTDIYHVLAQFIDFDVIEVEAQDGHERDDDDLFDLVSLEELSIFRKQYYNSGESCQII